MKVYKYRFGSKRDLKALQENYFHAPNSKNLNDPSEGLFSEKSIHNQFELFQNIIGNSISNVSNQLDEICQKAREEVGIYSLSLTPKDELLWAYYADSHTGFCIEYDLEKLKELRTISGSFLIDYAKQIPELNFDHIFQDEDANVKFLKVTTGTKSIKWQHEKEFRICIEPFGRFDYDYRAVKAIYFGMKMPKSKDDFKKTNDELPDKFAKVSQQQFMETLQGRGIKYYQMRLKEDSYEFDYFEIEDVYKSAKKYKDVTHRLPKDAVDYNDYGLGIEKDYFDKVAKIISKEPYFYALSSNIYASTNETKKRGQPIIFAGFYDKPQNPRKHIVKYFTLDEINEQYDLLDKP